MIIDWTQGQTHLGLGFLDSQVRLPGLGIIAGTFSGTIGVQSQLSGQIGCGGGVTAALADTALGGAGIEGKNAQVAAVLEQLSSVASGATGVQGLASLIVSVLSSLSGSLGTQGSIDSTFSFNLYLSELNIVEGTLDSVVNVVLSDILAQLAVSGDLTGNLEYLLAQASGQLGVSGELSLNLNIIMGAALTGKLGITAAVASQLQSLGISLVEITVSNRIYQILVSTQTAQVGLVAPTYGSVTMDTKTGGLLC